MVYNGSRCTDGQSFFGCKGQGYHVTYVKDWLGRGVWWNILFPGLQGASYSTIGVGSKVMVGTCGSPCGIGKGLSANW